MSVVETREIIQKVRRLGIRTRRLAAGNLSGEYRSVFRGQGMAFEEVRPYQRGDEVRSIDWHVSARMGELFVKVFAEERELVVMLLVDVSASGAFGSGDRAKQEVVAEVAALLAASALAANDRVGLLLFADQVLKFVPPRKGRRHVFRVLREILGAEPVGRGTDMGSALQFLLRTRRRTCVVFLISDFLDGAPASAGYERPLRAAARRHDLVPVVVNDSWEHALPDLGGGLVLAQDAESGERRVIDPGDPLVRLAFERARLEEAVARRKLFRGVGLDWLEVTSGDDVLIPLHRLFARRSRRLGR